MDVAITLAQVVDICSEGDMRDRRAIGILLKINSTNLSTKINIYTLLIVPLEV